MPGRSLSRASMDIHDCIEDPMVIKKILTHLKEKTTEAMGMLPEVRAPPQKSLFY